MVVYEKADHRMRIQQKPDIIIGTKFIDRYF